MTAKTDAVKSRLLTALLLVLVTLLEQCECRANKAAPRQQMASRQSLNNPYIPQMSVRDPENVGGLMPGSFGSSSGNFNNSDVPGQSLNQLLALIFGNYHKELVPKRPTFVKMDLLLLKVKSTIEKEGIFESVVALFIEWQDDRLLWNPDDYDNVTILAFESDKVWLPDIAMTNSADHLYSISKDTRFVVRVSHDGNMKFVPTGTARTWCDLKLLTFPFDMQTCSLEFESWSLDSSTMTFNDSSEALVDSNFASPQWALCKRSALVYDQYYNFTGETFTRVRFDFVVRRKSTFYIINLIFPCTTLSIIQLLVFVIPSTDSTSDRVGFGTTNLLTLVVFQTIVTEEMPKSSDAVTALSKYIIALIIISAVGIFESVIAERMLRTTATPPPKWAVVIMSMFPMLWSSQLPTGITSMILEGELDERHATPESNQPKKSVSIVSQTPDGVKTTVLPDQQGADRPTSLLIEEPSETQSSPRRKRKLAKRRSRTKQTANSHVVTFGDDESGTTLQREKSFIFTSLQTRIDKSMCNSQNGLVDDSLPMQPRNREDAFDNAIYYHSFQQNDRPLPAPPPRYNDVKATKTPGDIFRFSGFSPTSDVLGTSLSRDLSSIYNRDNSNRNRSDSSGTPSTKPILELKPQFMSAHAEQHEDKMVRIRNGRQWGDVVTRLDSLTFSACGLLAVGIPCFLFLPLMLQDNFQSISGDGTCV